MTRFEAREGRDYIPPPSPDGDNFDPRADATLHHLGAEDVDLNDPWIVLGRLIERRNFFSACDPVMEGTVALLLRTALVNGGALGDQLVALVETAGRATLLRVVEQLANFEAIRIVQSLPRSLQIGVDGKGEIARQRIAAVIEAAANRAQAEPSAAPAPALMPPNKGVSIYVRMTNSPPSEVS